MIATCKKGFIANLSGTPDIVDWSVMYVCGCRIGLQPRSTRPQAVDLLWIICLVVLVENESFAKSKKLNRAVFDYPFYVNFIWCWRRRGNVFPSENDTVAGRYALQCVDAMVAAVLLGFIQSIFILDSWKKVVSVSCQGSFLQVMHNSLFYYALCSSICDPHFDWRWPLPYSTSAGYRDYSLTFY